MPSDPSANPKERALLALDRAVYYLDRGLAPSHKVRAFANAAKVVAELDHAELEARVDQGTIADLAGVGRSTGSVIADAVSGRPCDYLARLDEETACPPLVGAEMRGLLRSDLHCHTTWSDGGASVRAMAETAIELGHHYIAVTDHSPRLTIAHGLSVERLREQLREIDTLREELAPFRILTGMEVDILEDGSLDLPEDALEQLDVVVASVHSKLRMDEPAMTERMVRAVASPHVDILGHCTGRKIMGTGRRPSDFDAGLVFSACARFGTAVEINCRPERRDPPDELIEQAIEWGCSFAINTDAHAPGQMEWQNWGCDLATRHGIEPGSVLNTFTADELTDWAGSHPS